MAPVRTTPPQHCDVCWARPNKQGMTMQICKSCQVGVHSECYGISIGATAPRPDFECWACRAVGMTVTVRQRDASTGKRLRIKVTERPTECCLCSVNDGSKWYHAMHPIYDHFGPSGRQMLLPTSSRQNPGDQPRLAWAHTLCCMAICSHQSTKGCVYGCTSDGAYGDSDDQYANSDTSSVNSALDTDINLSSSSTHHFVYCLPHKDGTEDEWTRSIRDHQQLKCHVCGKSDMHHSLRIPLQCSANVDHEFPEFRQHHRELDPGDTCFVAMHVGCAQWGKATKAGEYPNYRRVYFFPGLDLDNSDDDSATETIKRSVVTEPVINLFCPVHALDLVGHVKGADQVRYPAHSSRIAKAVAGVADSGDRCPPVNLPVETRFRHYQPHRGVPVLPHLDLGIHHKRSQRKDGIRDDARGRLESRIISIENPSKAKTTMTPYPVAVQDRKRPAAAMASIARPQTEEPVASGGPSDDPPLTHTVVTSAEPSNGPTNKVSGKGGKLTRRIVEDLHASIVSMVPGNKDDDDDKERMHALRAERRLYWREKLLSEGVVDRSTFRLLWHKVWAMAVSECEEFKNNGIDPNSSIEEHGSDNVMDFVEEGTLEKIVNGIVAMERDRSSGHLETILLDSKAECQNRWTKDAFDDLWTKVLEQVFRELNYSKEEIDWSFLLKSDGSKSLRDIDETRGETIDVLPLGQAFQIQSSEDDT